MIYTFEQRIRASVVARSEEEAREKLALEYGETFDFELVNVSDQ